MHTVFKSTYICNLNGTSWGEILSIETRSKKSFTVYSEKIFRRKCVGNKGKVVKGNLQQKNEQNYQLI